MLVHWQLLKKYEFNLIFYNIISNFNIKVFKQPLEEGKLLPVISIQEIFCNIDEIYRLHVKFLEALENRIAKWNPQILLSDLFQSVVKHLIIKT